MKNVITFFFKLYFIFGMSVLIHSQTTVFDEALGYLPAGWSQYGVTHISTATRLTDSTSWLATPSYDLTGWTSLTLTYDYGRYLAGGATFVDLQISTDGINWNAATITSSPQAAASSSSWTSVTVNISSHITPTSTTRFRWASVYGGIRLRNVKLIGLSTDPTIMVNPQTLSGFTYQSGSGPSNQQLFLINGTNLTGDISIIPPSDYEISATSGMSFVAANPLIIPHTGGSVNNVPVYVRLKSALLPGNYNNQIITASSPGAMSMFVVCNGTVTSGSSPEINVTPTTLSGFSYVEGNGPSAQQHFSISGVNLTGNITITPPANYEISTISGAGFSPSNPITLTQSSGVVSSTNIYVRLKAGLSSGTYNGENITASSSGALNKTITCNGSVQTAILPEPSNHVSNFSAIIQGSSNILLSWTDEPTATAYLIRMSESNFTDIIAPIDGIPVSDGTNDKNVLHGIESLLWTGLTQNVTYYFKIYPYSNSGNAINYKTDGVVPQASVLITEITDYNYHSTSCTVYPNPAIDYFMIDSDYNGKMYIKLLDSYGRLLMEQELEQTRKVDISFLQSGIYYVLIFNANDFSQNFKIVKK